jgi:hypothetical protein
MLTELRGNKLKAACEELIEAGLWKRRPGGFLFHDWEKYQPIRDDVERKRAADRERKAAGRVRADSERKPRRFDRESNSPVPSRPVHTPIPPPFRDVVRELDERVRADNAASSTNPLTISERQIVDEICADLDNRRAYLNGLNQQDN